MEDLFWGRFNGIVPATAKYHTSDATIRRLLKGFTEILAPLGLVINKSTRKLKAMKRICAILLTLFLWT